ncbi:hypothetical protein Dda_4392 [Drechslerella dactyloides]|uniref:Uncharacterized protein n=1 Tax=Drechslerella dactyloides TaxID=74499 RepID=A0AAD6NJ28_DREDA|nr:hypothetical protein Dda_4392 [Drechslerella dactyloides]
MNVNPARCNFGGSQASAARRPVDYVSTNSTFGCGKGAVFSYITQRNITPTDRSEFGNYIEEG